MEDGYLEQLKQEINNFLWVNITPGALMFEAEQLATLIFAEMKRLHESKIATAGISKESQK